MASEFNIPPVRFPTTTTQRRVPTAPFQPSYPSSSSLPFMSFDVSSVTTGSMSTSSSIHVSSTTTPSFEDEEPLLNELGIHPHQIWSKTKSTLNPVKVDPNPFTESDLSGPFLYYVLLSFFQLLSGKLQFGIILGWIVIFSIFLYVVFNMLAGRNGNLDLHTCTSIVGYSMLPLVFFSAVSLFLPNGGLVALGVGSVFVIWATRICAKLVIEVSSRMDEQFGLIVYPCLLVYTIMSMLIVF